MTADSIIEYVDPFKNVLPRVCSCPLALVMHVFRFQRMKETFDHGIIPAVPAPTHARRQAVSGQYRAVPGGGRLGPTAIVSATMATS